MKTATILKELRLRVFALRVMVTIHANRAMLFAMRSAKGIAKGITKGIAKNIAKIMTKGMVALVRKMSQTAWPVLLLVLRFLFRFLFARLLLPLLLKTLEASVVFLRKLCLRHPRTAIGGALLSLSLLFLIVVDRTPVEPQSASEAAEGIAVAPEVRLSLLPPVLPADKSQQQQQPSFDTTLPSRTKYRVLRHAIRSSLYETALEEGIPLPLLRRFVDTMSYDVDFQRDIWAGAHFRMLLSQQFRLGEGGVWQPLGEPVLEVAELYTGRQQYRYYRSGWNDAFYDEESKPAKRLLRRTPMSGLRLTSRFGLRRHPILGYTRMHKGVDFAAPRGTPILAAGDGVVRKKVYGKGYGRYVVLQHNDRLSTLYAHMRSFARGLRQGARVKQGQVIGYVGTSGMSTGAHLHYEIHRDGRAVNPRRVTLPKPKLLQESKRAVFAEKRRTDELWLARGGSSEEASALAALRALGCEVWSGMCNDTRRAQR